MDRYDPNQWTKEFVVENKDFCIRILKDTNRQVIEFLEQGEHEAVLVGLDRILNGLVTMINGGFDYRSQVCFFSWMQADVILFGDFPNAPEKNRLETAKKAYLDAKDFAKGPSAKKTVGMVLTDMDKGYDLSALQEKYGGAFPQFEIEALTTLTDDLDGYAAPKKKKKKKAWLIILLLILGAAAVFYLMNREVKTGPHTMEVPVQTEEITAPSTTAEPVTEPVTETETMAESTADPVEELRKSIIGTWIHEEIREGQLSSDGVTITAYRTEVCYTFDEDGRYSVSDGTYEEANEAEQPYGEWIGGRYWICIGGGGQGGSYSLSENELTLVSDFSVQYGESETSVKGFTLVGDELIIEHAYGTTAYRRSEG